MRLQSMQKSIEIANNVVVVGGGVAGVELATDAKFRYPHKHMNYPGPFLSYSQLEPFHLSL